VLGAVRPRGYGEKDQGQYDEERESGFFFVSGACLLIRKSLLSALGGECFDPFLFAYHEDLDLSWMARLLNGKVVYCPTSICHHKGGATSGGWNPEIAYLFYRNRLRVLIKNYSFAVLAIALPVFILMKLFLLSSAAILNMRFDYLKGFLRALWWNIQNITSTLDRRRFIQSRRELSDKEVMKYMVRHFHEVESRLKALSLGRGH
jgi:GT2 family glycosyltransferase